MLTLYQYNKLYGIVKGSFVDILKNRGIVVLAEGMLQFTEATAFRWGGPYPGNYAKFVLSDHSKELSYTSSRNKLNIKSKFRLESDQEYYKIQKEKAIRNKLPFEYPRDIPTIEKPIRLWIMGNDDTSYSKFYKNYQEAREELDLFYANEPLEFNIVYDFGFVFTN